MIDLKILKVVEQKAVGNDADDQFFHGRNRFWRLQFFHSEMIQMQRQNIDCVTPLNGIHNPYP
jgi:uncharacterized protein (DUF924 family)